MECHTSNVFEKRCVSSITSSVRSNVQLNVLSKSYESKTVVKSIRVLEKPSRNEYYDDLLAAYLEGSTASPTTQPQECIAESPSHSHRKVDIIPFYVIIVIKIASLARLVE